MQAKLFALSALEIMMPAPASDCMYPILLKWVPSKSLVMIMTKKANTKNKVQTDREEVNRLSN